MSAGRDKGATIVLAGKTGAGKTTLFNNLLGIKIGDIKVSARPDTEFEDINYVRRDGVFVKIVDTPGGSEIRRNIRQRFDVLLYCMHIGPGSKFVESNPEIMRGLHDVYGVELWKHCIIACTFSNLALQRCYRNCTRLQGERKYKDLITEFVTDFEKELKELGVNNIRVKSIFDPDIDENLEHCHTILAIPAGDLLEDPILPGAETREGCAGWKNIIFLELLTASKDGYKLVSNPVIAQAIPPPVKSAWEERLKSIGALGLVTGAEGAFIGGKMGLDFAAAALGPVNAGGLMMKGALAGGVAGLVVGAVLGGVCIFYEAMTEKKTK